MDFEITMLIIPLIVCLPIILTGIILLDCGVAPYSYIEYQYNVNGVTYIGNDKLFGLINGKRNYLSRTAALNVLNEIYPIGKQVQVYYRTDDPTCSYIDEKQHLSKKHYQDKIFTMTGII